MSFLHCHTPNCNWSQDDFWSKDNYNPFREDIIDYLKDCLFRDKIESDPVTGYGTISGTEYVARELENKAKSIRNMQVKTYEEWQQIKSSWTCPKCGKNNWDID